MYVPFGQEYLILFVQHIIFFDAAPQLEHDLKNYTAIEEYPYAYTNAQHQDWHDDIIAKDNLTNDTRYIKVAEDAIYLPVISKNATPIILLKTALFLDVLYNLKKKAYEYISAFDQQLAAEYSVFIDDDTP